MSDEDSLVRKPRALSLDKYQFNFKISVGARIAARAGAPAFASRRSRWDRAIRRFWRDLEERHAALWIAAREGRIDDEGREVRLALLDAEGRDAHAERLRNKELFVQRADYDLAQRALYDRAWSRVIDRLELEPLEAQAELYLRYFPIEANLPTDPDTGWYVWLGKPWEPVRAPTREDVLERWPLFG